MTVYAPTGLGGSVPMTKFVVQIPSIRARAEIGKSDLFGLQRSPLYFALNIDGLECSSHIQDFGSMVPSFNKMAFVNITNLTTILDFKHFFFFGISS